MPRPDKPVLLRLGFAAAAAVPLVYLVARDGSALWQAVRALVAVAVVAAAAGLLLRTGARWRGLGLLLVGAPSIAVGAGMSASWLSKAGLGVVSAAALLALLAGLVSLGLGIRDLAGQRPGWLGWLGVIALTLVAGVFLLALAIAVAGTNVPPTALAGDTPADRGLAYEDAFFTTADGVALSGWYIPSQNGAAVAVLHGAGSTRSNVLEHAAVLARAGYGVLLFDARGHGQSAGRAMDFGWFGDADIAAALDYLAGRPDVDPARLALVGFSMGAEEAVGAAAGDTRIRGVVAEGAVGRSAADHSWLSEAYGFRGWVQEGGIASLTGLPICSPRPGHHCPCDRR
jgi:uncharacterized protein